MLGNGPCHCKRGLDLGYRKQLEVSQCCTYRMNISQGVQAENLRVQDGRIALGDEVSALTEPVVAASPRPVTTQGCRRAGLTEMRHREETAGEFARAVVSGYGDLAPGLI